MENLHTSLYTIYVKLSDADQYLLVHGYTGAIDLVEPHVADFLRQGGVGRTGEQMPVKKESIEILKQRGYLTNLSPLEEKEHVRKMAEAMHKISSKKSSFLFLVAYDCNFRCPYCFENGISNVGRGWSKKRFSKEMTEQAYRVMVGIQPDREMHSSMITLYGGEPLLTENLEIVSHIISEGLKRDYRFSAITNGYDLQDYRKFLKPGVIETLQITIDGAPERHNRRRVHYADGGTFERIMNNVSMVLEAGVRVSIRVNTDRSNLDDLQSLSAIFQERGWTDLPNFSAYSALVSRGFDDIECNTVMSRRPQQEKTSKEVYATVDLSNKGKPMSTNSSGQDNQLNSHEIEADTIKKSEAYELPQYLYHPDSQYIDFKHAEQLFRQGPQGESLGEPKSYGVSPAGISDLLSRTDLTKNYYEALRKDSRLHVISCQDFSIKSKIKAVLSKKGLMPFQADYCGAQTGMIIFDPFGDLYTCWEVVGMENQKVGRYDPKLEIDERQLEIWRGRNISSVPACSKCKYAFFCGGGCEAHAILSGRGPRSPYCDEFPSVFRVVVPEAYKESLQFGASLAGIEKESPLCR